MKYLKDIKNWKECINQIVCGDCLEGMKLIPDKSIDLVLADPPYRMEKDNQPTKDMRRNGGMQNFGDKFNSTQYEEVKRISNEQIIFGVNNFSFVDEYKGFIVYKKKTISLNFTMSMAEIASISGGLGTISKVVEYAPQGNRHHPTQKPLDLIKWIISYYSNEGDLILDPFMGSWTTARACKDLGRDFIGFELSEEYCKIGEQRLRQEVMF